MIVTSAIVGSHVFVPEGEVPPSVVSGYDVRSRFDPKFCINTVKRVRGYVGFPMHNAPKIHSGEVVDMRSVGTKTDCVFTSVLQWDQEKTVKRVSDMLVKTNGAIIHADPAYGKTVCILKIITDFGVTTLVVVHKTDLVWQWVERITEHTDVTRDRIGVCIAGNLDYAGKDIVVGLVHTCAKFFNDKDFLKYFGMVVFDEVHSSVPPKTYAGVAGMFPAKYRLGATATPDRQDGMDMVFYHHVCRKENVVRAKKRIDNKAMVVVHGYKSDQPHNIKQTRGNTHFARSLFLKFIVSDVNRNRMVLDYIGSFVVNKNRRVIVVSDRTFHLAILGEMAKKRFPDSAVGFYCGKVPVLGDRWQILQERAVGKAELEETAENADIILATHKMLGEGTDLKNVSGLIYATPRVAIEQSKGRVEGSRAGAEKPVIVDIVDVSYPIAKRWFQKRKLFYTKTNATVVYRGVI